MNPPSPPRKQSFARSSMPTPASLILGSLPGEISLAHGQYYANRHNRFWALVGAVIEKNLEEMDYAPRLQTLLRHRIGLWDVVAEAQRAGSLDSRIRNAEGNRADPAPAGTRSHCLQRQDRRADRPPATGRTGRALPASSTYPLPARHTRGPMRKSWRRGRC